MKKQLESCGVEYFDFYLMHAQSRSIFEKYKKCRAYETAFELKKQGKICHVGLFFHDTADVLDMILTEYPDVEVILTIRRFRQEPAMMSAAGTASLSSSWSRSRAEILQNLPDDAQAVIDGLHGGSAAS